MLDFYKKRIDYLIQDKVTTMILLQVPELQEQFSNETAIQDIIHKLTEIYNDSDMLRIYHNAIVSLLDENNLENNHHIYAYFDDKLSSILNDSFSKIIRLLKYNMLFENTYREEILRIVNKLTADNVKTIPFNKIMLYAQSFEVSECWYVSGDNFVLFENLIQCIAKGEYVPNVNSINYVYELESKIQSIYEKELKDDLLNIKPLYITDSYPVLFIENQYSYGSKKLADKEFLHKLVYSYIRYIDILQQQNNIGFTISLDYLAHTIVKDFITNLCNYKAKEVVNLFVDNLEMFVCAYLDDSLYINNVDLELLLEYLHDTGFYDTWHIDYYMEHNEINKQRLGQSIENYITTNCKTNSVTLEEKELLYGIRPNDKKRIERLQANMVANGLIDVVVQPIIGAISISTNKGYIIEIHPNWLKIKNIKTGKQRTVYQRNRYDTALSAYVNSVKPSLFPYDEDEQKYLLHEIIIKSYDLRRK